jgi:hypothetical protein
MIKFKCPHCGKEVSAGDEHAGKKGRCPGCKGMFVIPSAAAAKPAPSAERRTPPSAVDEEDAPPKKKKAAAYDEGDLEVVEEVKKPASAKSVKRRTDEDEDEAIAEAPRKKRPARDDDDDEAVAEAPRKKRPARDDDDDEDDRPRKKRGRDDDDEDDEPRARKRRGRDDDEDEDEDDRPRKKRKKRRGQYANCPSCRARGDATRIYWQYGLGFLPWIFSTVRCNRCGTHYNGKNGGYNTTRYIIYFAIVIPIVIILTILGAVLDNR